MLTALGIIWHGTGILCIFGLYRLCPKLRGQLHGTDWKRICSTLGIGVVSGILGIVGAVILLENITSFNLLSYIQATTQDTLRTFFFILNIFWDMILRSNLTQEAVLVARSILIIPSLLLGPWLAGLAAGRILHKICHKDAVTTTALIFAVFMLGYPVVSGWLLRIWSLFA
jgi:uncharacterized membrane protein YfcA